MDQNEKTRLARTGAQALSAIIIGYLAKVGLNIDNDALSIVLFPAVMVAVTYVVALIEQHVPVIGPLIALLNGPRKAVDYTDPDVPNLSNTRG